MDKFGLVGYPLKHSFSKELHKYFGDYEYNIFELDEKKLEEFFLKKEFKGVNVTIPYKKKVFNYVDIIDEKAKKIGAINTVVNVDNKLYGYNTDYLGFYAMLKKYCIEVKGKNVLILGDGGTSRTVEYVIKEMEPKEVYFLSRKNEERKNFFTYENVYEKKDINVIINTTPVGMYNYEEENINIESFDLEAVVDVIYNPLKTKMIVKAENKNLKTATGLYMLVAQGFFASELFLRNKVDYEFEKIKEKIDNIYNKILSQKLNIVLIGMPTCGKSTIGKFLSEDIDREFIDTDSIIEEKEKMKTGDYINKYGENEFRNLEEKVIREVSEKKGVIISTGGGVILREENVINLKKNGYLFFINKSIEKLEASPDRPLTKTIDKLKQIYEERLPIYKKSANYIIDGNKEIKDIANSIKKILNEDFGWNI